MDQMRQKDKRLQNYIKTETNRLNMHEDNEKTNMTKA